MPRPCPELPAITDTILLFEPKIQLDKLDVPIAAGDIPYLSRVTCPSFLAIVSKQGNRDETKNRVLVEHVAADNAPAEVDTAYDTSSELDHLV